jgi:hypothetical protein
MTVTCQYCHYSYPAPQANQYPPQQQHMQSQQIPQIVIMHSHSSYDDSGYQVANAFNWGYWMIRGGLPFVVFIIIGISSVAFSLAGKSKMASSFVWDGNTPFDCGGVDEVAVTGVTANFTAGTAISVSGNCHFTCTDCNIKAPTAIQVDGNGSVTIINGTIIGTDVLADASGNAHVNINGNVTASGEVRQSNNAHVNAPKPATPPAAAKPAAPPAAAPAKPTPAAPAKPAAPAGSAKKH